jgi:hypothetical protein
MDLAQPVVHRPLAAPRPGPGRPRAYPGARLARIADAPPCCPNCGGPWRRLAASVACLICPTELYGAAELNRIQLG